MKKQLTAETLRKRKFLVVLPLLIFPFLTMAFWALGGGKEGQNSTAVTEPQKGFNFTLPQAKFNPDEKQDKFSVYETSAKNTDQEHGIDNTYDQLAFVQDQEESADLHEQKINEKLEKINTELNRQTNPKPSNTTIGKSRRPVSQSNISSDVDRLEDLMQSLQDGNEEDQEIAQLNAVLEKILEIQHPERAREKLKTRSSSTSKGSLTVHVAKGEANPKNLYALVKSIKSKYAESGGDAIQATIHQDQEIVSGSVVKLRLIDSIYVNGNFIPRNEFIHGIASVDGERLKIDIATLRHKNSILPVSLSAYDLDGLEGLYIPGGIARDASKRGAEDAIQSLQIMTMDPSVSAQVAGAGIQAAKGLFSRKVKQVRVKVKAGYQLLLRDNNQKR